jgi:hypothetical protein
MLSTFVAVAAKSCLFESTTCGSESVRTGLLTSSVTNALTLIHPVRVAQSTLPITVVVNPPTLNHQGIPLANTLWLGWKAWLGSICLGGNVDFKVLSWSDFMSNDMQL